ncbi:hypothetical protein FE257_012478 [Aspergillus nanangensis]|uniref:Uncharacterized protein n=1 Tax=Aspergillus nanangensis TaxID=2582783 RepID=A0AAD4GXK6_ASPNN|nr:hypothetical protein FE257_012478 [Aspergillus nanangensis]
MADYSPRRTRLRSSSLYEEWKSQALHNEQEQAYPIPQYLDNNPPITLCIREAPGQAEDHHPQPAQIEISTTHHQRQCSKSKRRGKPAATKAKSDGPAKESNLGEKEQSSEDHGYKAPNGDYLRKGELVALSEGVKITDHDIVFFRPSFLENPWKGVAMIKTNCLLWY